jgi:putative ABC transport system ATP-binding protein
MTLVEATGVGRTVDLADGRMLTILAGVDLTIEAGDRISIVGRSGSGKSTLLNLLGLLDAPTEGELAFLGDDVRRMSSGRRDRLRGREIGFIFQQFNLLQGRTAIENVQTPLLYAGDVTFWRRERIARDMLERVGLGERLEVRPERLSGGEQQRVAIARALVRRPRVILADEPTGALDLETGSAVMALIESVAAETGAALVTITHDPAIAARANRRFQLIGGRLEPLEELAPRGPLGGPESREQLGPPGRLAGASARAEASNARAEAASVRAEVASARAEASSARGEAFIAPKLVGDADDVTESAVGATRGAQDAAGDVGSAASQTGDATLRTDGAIGAAGDATGRADRSIGGAGDAPGRADGATGAALGARS